MIVHTAPQGSPEWHLARAGCITASNFHLIRAANRMKTGPRKGGYSEKALNYAFRLAIERISKVPLDEGFEIWQMQRGHDLEPVARMKREMRTGVLVEPVGFVTTDDGKFGASADGFVGDDEGDEYKCFISPEKLRAIYLTGDVSEVIDQCDGGMWITGRKAWTFGLYCPALESICLDLVLHRIERNDDRLYELERDLIEFERLVSSYESALRAKALGGVLVDVGAPTADGPPWEPPTVTQAAAARSATVEIPATIF